MLTTSFVVTSDLGWLLSNCKATYKTGSFAKNVKVIATGIINNNLQSTTYYTVKYTVFFYHSGDKAALELTQIGLPLPSERWDLMCGTT